MRFPLAPLERHLRGDPSRSWGAPDTATALGVSTRTVLRYRAQGLDHVTADHPAVGIGLHPSAVWGERWWLAANEAVPA